MKKSQPFENSQLQKDQQKDTTKSYINHTPKLARKPLSKFETYQFLLDEFYKANPTPTDNELSRACQYFADQCGLTVAAKAKGGQ